jgi:hypothetical protein
MVSQISEYSSFIHFLGKVSVVELNFAVTALSLENVMPCHS